MSSFTPLTKSTVDFAPLVKTIDTDLLILRENGDRILSESGDALLKEYN